VPTVVARLLDLAEELVQEGTRSSALRRRAVSTAYYAVFHALAKSCAAALLPSMDRASEIYERVYRALDHGSLRSAFASKATPLKDRETLKKIGELVIRLQGERHRADYLPPYKSIFSRDEAQTLIDEARRAVGEIQRLNGDDRIALATLLHFKSRPP
jgi:uncharacterized protein (UPF0332 family)